MIKEVRFDKYCSKCAHKDTPESDEPCCNCLQYPCKDNSMMPVEFSGDYIYGKVDGSVKIKEEKQ